jgi:DNA-binding transcriptional MerR regulator
MEQEYSIQELCDITGLPRRTIHFYTQQGLLPPPSGAGLGARYSDTHLTRLRLIPILRQRGLRLDQIRERFEQTSPDDLAGLLLPDDAASATHAPMAMLNEAAAPRRLRAQQNFVHYALPGGMMLVAPAVMNSYDRHKLARLLEAAERIFSEPTLPSQPRTTSE